MKLMSMAELGGQSQLICKGKVLKVISEWNDEGTFIWTYVTLAVDETIKGVDLSGNDIILKVPDGVVGDIAQRSSEQVSFEAGEDVVVFLEDEIHKGFHYE